MIKIFLIASLILLILIAGCAQIEPKKTLSELQTEACNTAHNAGTCNSRLVEVGIVLQEECCEVLGKCC